MRKEFEELEKKNNYMEEIQLQWSKKLSLVFILFTSNEIEEFGSLLEIFYRSIIDLIKTLNRLKRAVG